MNKVFLGRVVLSGKNSYPGTKYVFYNIGGGNKNAWRPVNGGVLQNPFKNTVYGKFFQGDLCEYTLDGKVTVLKTFEVAEAVAAAATTVKVVRDEFKHVPEVGDILMVAPAALATAGTGVLVTAVDDSADNVWTLTLKAAPGAIAKGAILVEAEKEGAGAKMLCDNPNSVLDVDAVLKYPTNNVEDGVIYNIAPVMHEIMYIDRMSPLPACVKAINKSRVDGLFEI